MMRPTMFLLAIAASSVALGQASPLPRALFAALDTDKDGNVSPAEGRAGGVIK